MVIVEGGRAISAGRRRWKSRACSPPPAGASSLAVSNEALPDAEGLEDPPAGIPALRVVPDRRPRPP